jgi:hypothetical protein
MQASADQSEFFYAQNDSAQKQILEWMKKRSLSLQRRMQEEMESKLEEIEFDTTKSTPFIRCIVRSAGFDPETDDLRLEDEAVLTIWEPSEERVAILKSGACIRLQKVDVQPHLYNGRKQLQARRETAIFVSPTLPPDIATKKASHHVYSSLLDVHVTIRSVENADDFGMQEPLNLIGCLVAIRRSCSSPMSTTLYLTDESNFLLKIVFSNYRGRLNQDLRALLESHSVAASRNTFAVVGFERLRARRFDFEDSCAVLACDEFSVVRVTPKCRRADRLQSWLRRPEKVRFLRLKAASAALGVPEFTPTENRRTLIGYILNFYLTANQQLVLQLDVGSNGTTAAIVPLEVLIEMQSNATAKSVECPVAFINDCAADQLQSLNWVYQCRHVLFKFTVDRAHANETATVLSMEPIDAGVLAELYASQRRKG